MSGPERRKIPLNGRTRQRRVRVGAHGTTVRMEDRLWEAFREICRREGRHQHDVLAEIAARQTPGSNFTSALRVYIVDYFLRG